MVIYAYPLFNVIYNRRNLNPVQRIAVAKKYETQIKAKAKENLIQSGKQFGKELSNWINPIENKINSREEIAKSAQISPSTVVKYDVVEKSDGSKIGRNALYQHFNINT